MAKLIFTDKNFSGRSYEIVLEKTTVGRGDQNTLVIRDPSLSSAHCEILMHGPEIIIRDLDSLNGTFVDGHKLNKQAQVKSGQTVRFGSVEARLELESDPRENDTAEITAVHSLGKIMRDQRRAQKRPPPGDPSMQLEPENHAEPEERTILIPRPPDAPPATPPASAQTGHPRPDGGSKRRLAFLIALAGVALLILLWLLSKRK